MTYAVYTTYTIYTIYTIYMMYAAYTTHSFQQFSNTGGKIIFAFTNIKMYNDGIKKNKKMRVKFAPLLSGVALDNRLQ